MWHRSLLEFVSSILLYGILSVSLVILFEPEGCCGGRDGKVRFSHPEGYRQQDQVQGASEVALVLPDVPEAVPGREWLQVSLYV